MSGAVIRHARPAERFAVLALCRDFHEASGIPFDFCPAHASRTAQGFIEDASKLCLVLEVDGALRGVLAACAAISPLAPVKIAEEIVFWIDPAHRGRVARRMLSEFENWARAQGCAGGGLSGLNDRRVARFFSGAGFELVENKFLKMWG